MLVLSRHRDESIIVTLPDGRRGTITVVEIRNGDKVRLGLDFPRDVPTHRAEVQAVIDRGEGRAS